MKVSDAGRVVLLAACLSLLPLGSCSCSGFFRAVPADVSGAVAVSEVRSLWPAALVEFESMGLPNFTCTGLAFDSSDAAYWVGDLGRLSPEETTSPRLIEVNEKFDTALRVVDLSNELGATADLQGVAYDSSSDSLWIATGDCVHNISKEGAMLSSVRPRGYETEKTNGLAYDPEDDTLWILCQRRWLLHINKSGEVLKAIPMDYADQDHIAAVNGHLYLTIGADYTGSNNYLAVISPSDGSVESLTRLERAYAVEGVCLNGSLLVVLNDGLFHDAAIPKSYACIYDVWR